MQQSDRYANYSLTLATIIFSIANVMQTRKKNHELEGMLDVST